MFGAIGRWLLGGGISAIGAQVNEWQRIRAQAQNDQERIEAEKMIATLQARQAVLAQDAQGRWVRVGFALPFIIYNGKLVVWDKILGWGVTDPLSDHLVQIEMIVIGFYFLHHTVRVLRR